ncbi:MAG: hypothetical protein JO050_04150 [Acidimicrobiia bacterium]|nr:hypothetical protein [Acidimicrobiia bacterium]
MGTSPSSEEMAAIVAAVALVWPRPVPRRSAAQRASTWRWSGRWWGPLTQVSGRQRPWR